MTLPLGLAATFGRTVSLESRGNMLIVLAVRRIFPLLYWLGGHRAQHREGEWLRASGFDTGAIPQVEP
jgi:hypothetical protein